MSSPIDTSSAGQSGLAFLGPVRHASLSVRLALLLGSLTAAVIATVFFGLSLGTRARARETLAREIGSHQRALLTMRRQTLQQILVTSALLGESPALRAALATYREESILRRVPRADLLRTIRSVLDSMAAVLPQPVLMLTDGDGRVVFASDRTGPPALSLGTDLSHVPAVKEALDGTEPTLESSFAIVSLHGAPFQLGCVPAIQNGQLIGVLLLGDRLDAPALEQIKTTVGSDVVIRTRDSVLASSLPGIDGLRLQEGAGRGSMTIAGENYVVASLSIGRDDAGNRVMLDLLRSISATASDFQGPLTRSFLLYGLLAVAIATIAAAFIARAQLRSFRDFVGFMGAVAQSRDYSRRFFDHHSTPEMRTLADAYGHLISSLRDSHVQVEARGADLVQANVVLRQQIEERERAERALQERDEQLRQSQKLEAIGTLAGGVAHDFNNLLTVIHSYCELLMVNVGKQSPLHPDLEQIRQASARAGRLTTQLLAFSRKQVMQPRVLDLNGVVAGVEKMLRRLIGEHIVLETATEPSLARAKADPGQLEQVIMNLAVNARDAMPTGGRLVITTGNVSIYQADLARHGETPPGAWVTLSVTDSGTGMDQATMRRIFEPFFTTKGVGKGTGLGLAMVYGIVKQSGGHIHVTSEVGQGSTFRIYLPAIEALDEIPLEESVAGEARGGTETVLLVEDEDMVRALSARTLQGHGYTVLAASHGPAALEAMERHHGQVQLLLTDVVMPHMSGKELAEEVKRLHPGIRVLYMTGYTEDAIVRHGMLETGALLLQKPFTPSGMARRVREVLDAPPGNGVAVHA